jgi:hypothetical protein
MSPGASPAPRGRSRARSQARSAERGLVLCVIDALAPQALAEALASGATPTLAELIDRGFHTEECVAPFPSVTPVCAASITTGHSQDEHGVPGMCWFDRERDVYVEYGSSLSAARRVGIARQLTDTVYNLNRHHLSPALRTIFERLDDAGVRTACTTYLIFRGRHRHEPRRDDLLTRLAAPVIRHAVMGPQELFYADIFASRPLPCSSLLGMPGMRDRHAACVAGHLLAEQLCDFLLLSLPDNDWHSHRGGPRAQVRSLAQADAHLAAVIGAAGGIERFLDRYGMIVMGDHAQADVQRTIDLFSAFESYRPRRPGRPGEGRERLAICPSQRAAMLYALPGPPTAASARALAARALALEGVELACYLEVEDRKRAVGAHAVIVGARSGELRIRPRGEWVDARGAGWEISGDARALGLELKAGRVRSPHHPDALGRVWAALVCERAGDLLLSAAPGYEFLDIGGRAHPGGGSHGSLRAEDSLTALIATGLRKRPAEREQWAIGDVAALVCEHFKLPW